MAGYEIKLNFTPAGGLKTIACEATTGEGLKTYICLICGFVYDEAAGHPEDGIPPGTKWEDVPMNWTCPECNARKEDFEMIEL